MKFIITGGNGFIAFNLINRLLKNKNNQILNIDKNFNKADKYMNASLIKGSNYKFIKLNILNNKRLKDIIFSFNPNVIIHLAAESHVDNSIKHHKNFINSNILGTYNLLNISNEFTQKINKKFIFYHISTDEVYGSLKYKEKSFMENDPYKPNSPYSASKAASDHLVRAWHKTFNLNVLISHCSNNYGPWQKTEKLIPKIIECCLLKKKIPIYGDGKNIRDWIFVDDHIDAILLILKKGKIGNSYNIGSNNEVSNIKIANIITEILNDKIKSNINFKKLINFVDDRKGHDFRYSVNTKKINQLGFKPKFNLTNGLNHTIEWYLDNKNWFLK